MVRVAAYGRPFGAATLALNHTLTMSHNTAFLCVANRTLVAIGGQLPDGAEELHSEQPGIMRREADARRLPLVWSRAVLVASGLKRRSRCIDARWNAGCDFDGKISAVRFRGRVLLYTRANLLTPPWFANESAREAASLRDTPDTIPHNDAGGRHVQVAEVWPLSAAQVCPLLLITDD